MGKFSEGLLMRAQVIHNQVNRPLVPAGHHHFFPESLARFRILVRGPSPYRCSCGGAESSKPLQRSTATISVRSPGRTLTPLLAASGNGLKRSQFVKTDDNPSFRRMTIEVYDGVFLRRTPDLRSGTTFVRLETEDHGA